MKKRVLALFVAVTVAAGSGALNVAAVEDSHLSDTSLSSENALPALNAASENEPYVEEEFEAYADESDCIGEETAGNDLAYSVSGLVEEGFDEEYYFSGEDAVSELAYESAGELAQDDTEDVVITWDANGGIFHDVLVKDETTGEERLGDAAAIENIQAKKTYLASIPGDPTRTGYVFAGWGLAASGGDSAAIEWISGTEQDAGHYSYYVNGAVTFYALWKEEVRVTWDANGGVFKNYLSQYDEATQTTVYQDCETIVDKYGRGDYLDRTYYNPERSGYVFQYWASDQAGNQRVDIDYYYYEDVGMYHCAYAAAADVTIYAIWAEAATITWDANGGVFKNELVFDEESNTTKEVDLGNLKTIQEKNSYLNCIVRDPVREGFVFKGWSKDSDGKEPVNLEYVSEPDRGYYSYFIDSDQTLYAVWERGVAITFDGNGGSFFNVLTGKTENNAVDSIKIGGKLDDSTIFNSSFQRCDVQREGSNLIFLGWSRTEDGTDLVDSDTAFSEDATLYAAWIAGYHIILDFNGGYLGKTNVTSVDSYIVPGDPAPYSLYNLRQARHSTDEKMVLLGWSTDKNDTEGKPLNEFVPSGDTTYFAVWKAGIHVTLDLNGGYYGESDCKAVDGYILSGDNAKFPAYRYARVKNSDPTKYFAGWSTDRSAATGQSLSKLNPKTDTTYWAVWTSGVHVTLDLNGGYYQDDPSKTTLNGVVALGRSAKIKGYTFRCVSRPDSKIFHGWSTDKSAAKGKALRDLKPTGDVTYYAVWSDCYTVQFRGRGGFLGDAKVLDVSVPKGQNLSSIQYLQAVKNDKHKLFSYWSEDRKGTKQVDLSTYVPQRNVKLYSNWKEVRYVVLDANGGFFSVPTETQYVAVAEKGSKLQYLPSDTPSRSGETFWGWSFDQSGTRMLNKDLSDYIPEEDVTLFAIYRSSYVPDPVTTTTPTPTPTATPTPTETPSPDPTETPVPSDGPAQEPVVPPTPSASVDEEQKKVEELESTLNDDASSPKEKNEAISGYVDGLKEVDLDKLILDGSELLDAQDGESEADLSKVENLTDKVDSALTGQTYNNVTIGETREAAAEGITTTMSGATATVADTIKEDQKPVPTNPGDGDPKEDSETQYHAAVMMENVVVGATSINLDLWLGINNNSGETVRTIGKGDDHTLASPVTVSMNLPERFLRFNLKVYHSGVKVPFSWIVSGGVRIGITFAIGSLSPIEILATDPADDAKEKANRAIAKAAALTEASSITEIQDAIYALNAITDEEYALLSDTDKAAVDTTKADAAADLEAAKVRDAEKAAREMAEAIVEASKDLSTSRKLKAAQDLLDQWNSAGFIRKLKEEALIKEIEAAVEKIEKALEAKAARDKAEKAVEDALDSLSKLDIAASDVYRSALDKVKAALDAGKEAGASATVLSTVTKAYDGYLEKYNQAVEAKKKSDEERKRAELKKAGAIKTAEASAEKAVQSGLDADIKAAEEAVKNAIAAGATDTELKKANDDLAAAKKKAEHASAKTTISFRNAKVTKALNAAGTKTARIRMRTGTKLKLKAKASDGSKLIYKASNKKAAVNAKGVIKAKKAGRSKVTVTAGNAKVEVLLKITKK